MEWVPSYPMKKEAECSTKMWLFAYRKTKCYNKQHCNTKQTKSTGTLSLLVGPQRPGFLPQNYQNSSIHVTSPSASFDFIKNVTPLITLHMN